MAKSVLMRERGLVKEFGVDDTEVIKRFVVGAMDKYSYLKQYAINQGACTHLLRVLAQRYRNFFLEFE